MKKKTLIISISIIVSILIIGLIILLLNKDNNKETYSEINIEGYKFSINDKYEYSYDEKNKQGTFKNKIFPVSYIFLSENDYASLITESSSYKTFLELIKPS